MSAFQIIEAAQRVCEKRKWRCVSSRLEEIQSAPHYCEPGYSTEHKAILFVNWNDPCNYSNRERKEGKASEESRFFAGVVKALEACAELEWSDEWTTCSECSGALRTSGDCYGWQRAYVEIESDTLCADCAKEHSAELVTAYEGSGTKALTSAMGIDLAELGFARLEQRFENGLYGGQDSDPERIAASLHARGISRFVFVIDDVGQFDLKFSLWLHSDESGKLTEELTHSETACALDPAQGLKRALQDVHMPSGDGITYVKCDVSKGTATARKVPPPISET